MATVGLKNICKDYGKTRVVHHVTADIRDGEFIVIVGPSGCGKSTVLRMIAGLETVTEGEVRINDAVVNLVEPKDRRIAMVFQNYALYPHMTVFNNMAYGLKLRKLPKDRIRERVNEAARVLQLEELLDRKPRQLSGGQRQRVAMGRALVRQPEVFLFDEPLSNLDAKLRHQMRTQLKQLHRRLNTTMIYVTHDQVEAMTLADRILVLNRGVIEQMGTPDEIYKKPVSAFVAGFIGSPPMNFLKGALGNDGRLTLVGDFQVRLKAPPDAAGPVTVGLRPEKMVPAPDGQLAVTIDFIERLGAGQLLYGQAGDDPVVVSVRNGTAAAAGASLRVGFDETDLHFFHPETGQRIS